MTYERSLQLFCSTKSYYTQRATVLVFKDANAPQFGHGDVVFYIFSNEHQKVPPVNHQQKCLIDEN